MTFYKKYIEYSIKRNKNQNTHSMDILKFFAILIGGLMIAHCFIYLRLKPKEFNNVLNMFLNMAISISAVLLVISHASWWSIALLLYLLLLLRMSVCGFNGRLWDYEHGGCKVQKIARIILSWVTLIAISTISIKAAMMYATWYITVVYLPVTILACIAIALRLKDGIESLD